MRARLLPADCTEIALERSSEGTALAVAACWAGAMKAKSVPMQNPNAASTPAVWRSASTTAESSAATAPTAARDATSIFLRSTRSATTPASGATTSIGMNVVKNKIPSQSDELSVTRAISDCIEMCEIQNPTSPMA